MCTVLCVTLANRATAASARCAVARPSYAMAQEVMGDGLLAHTITLRSAIRINAETVLPSPSAGEERPRFPTSTVSTSRASVASSVLGSPNS